MTNDIVIEVQDVHKSFKTVHAVRGVSLRIKRGQFVALLGPNGAGKTTLVEMIEGIQKPDRGEISILGKQWKGNEDELHRMLGISLQETRYVDKLTVSETLNLFGSFYRLGDERVTEIISTVGLEEKKKSYVVNLSGGQRQRLALGIALLNRPTILLLDEPTTGLDPNARREVWSILLDLKKKEETSLILTSHYMEEAERLCDYIVIIDKGVILREGTLKELVDEDHAEKMIEFTLEKGKPPPGVLENDPPFEIRWDSSNDKGVVAIGHMETELPKFLHFLREKNLRLENMECRRRTLDDLFTSLTGRHLHD